MTFAAWLFIMDSPLNMLTTIINCSVPGHIHNHTICILYLFQEVEWHISRWSRCLHHARLHWSISWKVISSIPRQLLFCLLNIFQRFRCGKHFTHVSYTFYICGRVSFIYVLRFARSTLLSFQSHDSWWSWVFFKSLLYLARCEFISLFSIQIYQFVRFLNQIINNQIVKVPIRSFGSLSSLYLLFIYPY